MPCLKATHILVKEDYANPSPHPYRMKINATWHKTHRMPKNASLEEKIKWHMGHTKHCLCRDSKSHLNKLKRELAK
jgi:hypothetical protein